MRGSMLDAVGVKLRSVFQTTGEISVRDLNRSAMRNDSVFGKFVSIVNL